MSTTAPRQRPPADLAAGLFLGGLSTLFIWTAVTITWWAIGGAREGYPLTAWLAGCWQSLLLIADLSYHPSQAWLATSVATPAALLGGIWLGWLAAEPGPAERHLEGRQLIADPARAAQLAALEGEQEIGESSPGINIHPDVQMSTDRETRGMLIAGAIGAGKTVVIKHLLHEILQAGDRVIVLDSAKGDFTQSLLGLPRTALLAPWDSRSLAWDVAHDYRSRTDARELAAAFIPPCEGEGAVWSNGARQILAGMIRECQVRKPNAWTFSDVAALIEPLADIENGGYEVFRAPIIKHIPESALILAPELNRTVLSYLANVGSYLTPITELADAWSKDGHGSKPTFISMEKWIRGQYKNAPRALVFQMSRRFRQISMGYVQALITALVRLAGDPSLPDSKTRRIWLVLDEFPQAGLIENFEVLIEIGRSKGFRLVIGTQDIAQLEERYGAEKVKSWETMLGTWIITRSGGKATPRFFSDLCGDRDIERWVSNTSTAPGLLSGTTINTAGGYQPTTAPVVRPDEFSTLLGRLKHGGRDGIAALLHTGKDYVYRLHYPFTSALPPRVESVDPAPWTSPGWPGDPTLTAALSAIGAAQATVDATPLMPTTTPTEIEPRPLRPELATPTPAQTAAEHPRQTADQEQDHEASDDLASEVIGEAVEIAADAVAPGADLIIESLDMIDTLDEFLPSTTTTLTPATPATAPYIGAHAEEEAEDEDEHER